MSNAIDKTEEVDINDAFEEILFSEEKIIEEGYKEGFSQGSSEDSIDGYHLGYHRGAEIGSEIGYYKAFAEFHFDPVKHSEFPEKVLKTLEIFQQSLEDFPYNNTDKEDIIELVEKIRNLYKRICIQLKIKLEHKSETLNF